MKEMILNNIFPVTGGTAGALYGTTLDSTSSLLDKLPSIEAIVITIVLALIGAVTGFLIGKLCRKIDKWLASFRNKGKVEYR